MTRSALARTPLLWFGLLALIVVGVMGLIAASSSPAEPIGAGDLDGDALRYPVPSDDSSDVDADDNGSVTGDLSGNDESTAGLPQRATVRAAATDSTDLGVVVPGLATSVPIDASSVAVAPDSGGAIDIRVAPSSTAPISWTLGLIDEFGQPRVFRVLERNNSWLRVQVPVRPNGSEGWIHHDDVDLEPVTHRMLIDLSDRSVVVWDGDDVVLDTTGAIGRPATPTPTGSFYVRSVFAWNPDSVYGPWVLPLSAYSEEIDQINGGDAVVAIHGTQRPDQLGQAVSLGCIRLENDVVTQLASIVPAGTPVEIVP